MRYLLGFMCVLAVGIMPLVGCSETTGDGGSGGSAGSGGTGGMPQCESPEDCEDDNECTDDTCSAGVCEFMPVPDPTGPDEPGGPPGDGTTCGYYAGTCEGGSCVGTFACTEAGIREAIAAGAGPHTFDCAGPTTVTTADEIVIDNDVILDGEGNLTVDGDEDHRVFTVEEGVTAGLQGLTVTKGGWIEPRVADESGGGILNLGTLSLANCSVTQCSVPSSVNPMGGWGTGAGISNPGTLTMTNCTVSGNSADEPGGGIFNGGTARLTNSTVSGNTPGAILNVHEGTMAITNSTVSANGDLAIAKVGGPGTLTLANSLVDGGCSPTDPDWPTISNGYNIESPGDTCGFDQTGDQVSVTAEQLNLGSLADNGGPTMTHALEAGSVAIDVIPEDDCVDAEGELLAADQRGEPRFVGLPFGPFEPVGDGCDVGAFEWQPEDL